MEGLSDLCQIFHETLWRSTSQALADIERFHASEKIDSSEALWHTHRKVCGSFNKYGIVLRETLNLHLPVEIYWPDSFEPSIFQRELFRNSHQMPICPVKHSSLVKEAVSLGRGQRLGELIDTVSSDRSDTNEGAKHQTQVMVHPREMRCVQAAK